MLAISCGIAGEVGIVCGIGGGIRSRSGGRAVQMVKGVIDLPGSIAVEDKLRDAVVGVIRIIASVLFGVGSFCKGCEACLGVVKQAAGIQLVPVGIQRNEANGHFGEVESSNRFSVIGALAKQIRIILLAIYLILYPRAINSFFSSSVKGKNFRS